MSEASLAWRKVMKNRRMSSISCAQGWCTFAKRLVLLVNSKDGENGIRYPPSAGRNREMIPEAEFER